MTESGQIDVEIRQKAVKVLVSQIIEETEDGGTQKYKAGSGFSGSETIKFVLVDAEGAVIVDAGDASIVSNPDATVSFNLTATHTVTAGRYTYYWIIDDTGGGGDLDKTDDLTMNIGAAPDTYVPA